MTDWELLSARLAIATGIQRSAQEALSEALSSPEPGKGLRVWSARRRLKEADDEVAQMRMKKNHPVKPRPFELPDSCVKKLEEHFARRGK